MAAYDGVGGQDGGGRDRDGQRYGAGGEDDGRGDPLGAGCVVLAEGEGGGAEADSRSDDGGGGGEAEDQHDLWLVRARSLLREPAERALSPPGPPGLRPSGSPAETARPGSGGETEHGQQHERQRDQHEQHLRRALPNVSEEEPDRHQEAQEEGRER